MNDRIEARTEREAIDALEAALELSSTERRDFIRSHPTLGETARIRAMRLLDAGQHSNFGEGLQTGGAILIDADDEPEPEYVGAYRILRLIGRGGMGNVYLGERAAGDFEHVVAIKVIKRQLITDELVERFRRERQILANLTHPNIARLYDGGETDEGAPYFVMEFVEGLPLGAWLRNEPIDLETRLDIFSQICRAVESAHRRLIIHRDLTPPNILVTPDGQAKLIDFGIAAPHREDAQGQADSHGFTPGFGAPEQREGAPVDTLSDVYALGKLLALMTEGENDRELNAIAMKASAENGEDRYTGVAQLARDIANYRRGYVVEAYSEAPSYRLRKYVRRNLVPVALASLLSLLLIASLIAVTDAYRDAARERDLAEERYNQVRSLAKTLLFDAYDSVDALPGSTAAREMLARTAQSYLDALAQDADAPLDVRLEAGRGYMRLADVMGGVGGGNLGLREEALANYEHADAILTDLHTEAPGQREVSLALADLRYARSNMALHVEDDMARGLVFAESIEGVLEKGCDASDPCTLRRAQMAIAKAQNHAWLEAYKEAVGAADRALALLARMSAKTHRTSKAARLEALAHRFKGDALYYLDDVAGSAEQYDLAIRRLERAGAHGLENLDIARDLALLLWSRGGVLDELGRVEEAVATLDEARAIMQQQVDADPNDAGSLRLLAVVNGQRGLTLSSADRFREAIAAAEASLATRRRLSRLQPDQSGFARDVAIQLHGLGEIHAKAGNRASACRHFRAAIAQFDQFDVKWGMSDFDRSHTYVSAKAGARGC
ncbi:MAG: hypothetical protein CVT75_07385 [Alphaproteobacteria bacterium HGW-Alphaproteobacteria-14]|nr:MAG: hypothetical protein CVT75_07385 [Alphaproteobacteria bacterium HGW-Alphaproteobacteria-14]